MIEIGMSARPAAVQDVAAMWESDAAAEWERINADDPYSRQMAEAAGSFTLAVEYLDKALDWLIDALSAVDGSPLEKRVEELKNKAEDLKVEVDMQKDKYERGERE